MYFKQRSADNLAPISTSLRSAEKEEFSIIFHSNLLRQNDILPGTINAINIQSDNLIFANLSFYKPLKQH